MRELATQRSRVDVVHERAVAVDLHDGEPLAVAGLQVRLARDVDLLELEPELVPRSRNRLASPLAEVAPRRVIEDEPRGYG